MLELRNRAGLRDLKIQLLSFITKLVDRNPIEDLIEKLADIAGLSDPDAYQYARKAAIRELVTISVGTKNRNHMEASKSLIKKIRSRSEEPGMKRATDDALKKMETAISDLP